MTDLFDTHCHIQDRAFNTDRSAVLARARSAGVREMVVVGEDEPSSRDAIDLAQSDPYLWSAVGLHPHEAKRADAGFDARLDALARVSRVVAIGEIGLDFHYDRSPRDVQAAVFRRQLTVAAARDLPVIIHSREAEAETLTILGEWSAQRRRTDADAPLGVMHCFGYGVGAMQRFVDLGSMISIPGTVTYPNAQIVRDVARATPDGMLVIETDAPVLAPQGHRGRRNEPAYLVVTAEGVAAARGVSVARLAEQTAVNARRLFRLPAQELAPTGVGSVPA